VRATAAWERGGWGASSTIHFTNSYTTTGNFRSVWESAAAVEGCFVDERWILVCATSVAARLRQLAGWDTGVAECSSMYSTANPPYVDDKTYDSDTTRRMQAPIGR